MEFKDLKKENENKFVYLVDRNELTIVETQLKECKIELFFLWYNDIAYKIGTSVFLDPIKAAECLISVGQKQISTINSKIELAQIRYLTPYLKG